MHAGHGRRNHGTGAHLREKNGTTRNQNMRRSVCVLACIVMLSAFTGCGSKHEELLVMPNPVPVSSIQVRVTDVSNDTTEIFDVDVIGLLWSSLDDSLKKRGMLWKPNSEGTPLSLEAHVTRYQKGSAWLRPCFPYWGRTLLEVKAELKDQGRVVGTAEAKGKFTLGSGTFTRDGGQKIFAPVADDIVSQLLMRR